MNAQNYIIGALKKWTTSFVGIKIKYAYDPAVEYHIVEVEPESIRRGNSDYKKAELQLWMDFATAFPDENLLITAPSEGNDMSNVLFEYSLIISQSSLSCGIECSALYMPAFSFGKDVDVVGEYIDDLSYVLAA